MALARKPFVVLDAEILSSSVWSEAAHVRLVWITLLILCDTEGYVGASLPGIASAAGVTLEQAQEAIARLQEPDPFSRTKNDGGRRLALADRGWRILNFQEHLNRLSSERARARERMKRWRDRKRLATKGDVTNPTGNREKGTGRREQGKSKTASSSLRSESWSYKACDLWSERFNGGTPPGGRIGNALKPLIRVHGEEIVLNAWKRYLSEQDEKFVSPQAFASKFGSYANLTRPKAILAEPKDETEAFRMIQSQGWLTEFNRERVENTTLGALEFVRNKLGAKP